MKKLAIVAAGLSCCFLANSQELEVRLIPRVDVNTIIPASKDASWDVDFGNTSFYTLVEGTFAENFSYSVENHWLSIYGYQTPGSDIADLYTNSLRTDSGTWLDWANITYTLGTNKGGAFDFTLGKMPFTIGSYEIDAYDFDSYFQLNSNFWNNTQSYQWGGKIGYTTPSESTSIYLQATTSPAGGMLFRDKQYGAYGLSLYGDYGCFAPIYSINFVQYAKGSYENIIGLGNQFYVGDLTLGLDYVTRARSVKHFFEQNLTLTATAQYSWDKVDLFGKFGYELVEGTGNYLFGGAGVNWYPLKNSKELAVHAVISANNWINTVSVNLGVIYNFVLTDHIRRK